MTWFIYAIYNKEANKIYIGSSGNINRRLYEHNAKLGNHFTAKVEGLWKLIYKEGCSDKKTALKREKELKSYQGRQFIKKFIID